MLLLGDGRFPSGGHAHSCGLEAAVADGAVQNLRDLESFLNGWLFCGLEAEARLAALAADPQRTPDAEALGLLDEECEAALPSPALRRIGRSLGKALLRSAHGIWPEDLRLAGYFDAVRRHAAAGQHPAAFGVATAACLGTTPDAPGTSPDCPLDATGGPDQVPASGSAALAYTYCAVTGAAWSAVRLLPVDPVQIAGMIARLQPAFQQVAAQACGANPLPAAFAPLHELRAEQHAGWEVRLFAS